MGPNHLGHPRLAAMLVVLMTFGTALGLTVVSPQPYAGISAKGLAVLAGVYAALVHVASFAAGGYLAGRMRTPWATTDLEERNFRDGGHGFGVWALGVVLGATLAASGIAGVVKTAVGATTAVAAAGMAGAASIRQGGCAAAVDAADRLRRRSPARAGAWCRSRGRRRAPANRADIAAPIARTFAANMQNPQLDARDRTYLASLVSQRTGDAPRPTLRTCRRGFHRAEGGRAEGTRYRRQGSQGDAVAAFLVAATLAIGAAAACAGAALGPTPRRADHGGVVRLAPLLVANTSGPTAQVAGPFSSTVRWRESENSTRRLPTWPAPDPGVDNLRRSDLQLGHLTVLTSIDAKSAASDDGLRYSRSCNF